MIAVPYWASPKAKVKGVKWITPGSFLALVIWLVASAAFAFYVANFASYDKDVRHDGRRRGRGRPTAPKSCHQPLKQWREPAMRTDKLAIADQGALTSPSFSSGHGGGFDETVLLPVEGRSEYCWVLPAALAWMHGHQSANSGFSLGFSPFMRLRRNHLLMGFSTQR